MRTIGIICCLLLGSLNCFACNSCASAGNTGTLGFGSQVDRTLISMRFESRSLTTTHPRNLEAPELDNHSFEAIRRATLFGQYILRKRVLFAVNIPYLINSQESELPEYNGQTNGIGDMSFYTGWSQPILNDSAKLQTLRFRAIAGIKVPTGMDNGPEVDAGLIAPVMQRGTGSVDLNIILGLTGQLSNWMYSGQLSLWYNGLNDAGYRYGRTRLAQLEVSRNIKISTFGIQPLVRIRQIHTLPNQWKGQDVDLTGGFLLDGAAGLRFTGKKWIAESVYYYPVAQEQASNKVVSNNVWQFSVTRLMRK